MKTLQPLKSSTTASQQLTKLQSRGLIVDDVNKALHYLNTIGYYRLSDYFYPFRQLNDNRQRLNNFIFNSHFADVIRLYMFDKKLRLLAFDALERIEMAIRVDIANSLARCCSNAHEYIEHLDHNRVKEHLLWLTNLNSI